MIPIVFSLVLYASIGPFVLLTILVNETIRLCISIHFLFKYPTGLYKLSRNGSDGLYGPKVKNTTSQCLLAVLLPRNDKTTREVYISGLKDRLFNCRWDENFKMQFDAP